jgi:hypothetical protein
MSRNVEALCFHPLLVGSHLRIQNNTTSFKERSALNTPWKTLKSVQSVFGHHNCIKYINYKLSLENKSYNCNFGSANLLTLFHNNLGTIKTGQLLAKKRISCHNYTRHHIPMPKVASIEMKLNFPVCLSAKFEWTILNEFTCGKFRNTSWTNVEFPASAQVKYFIICAD